MTFKVVDMKTRKVLDKNAQLAEGLLERNPNGRLFAWQAQRGWWYDLPCPTDAKVFEVQIIEFKEKGA